MSKLGHDMAPTKGTQLLSTQQLAASYMEGAQQNYKEHGVLESIVAFHGGPQELIVQIRRNPDQHPSDQVVSVVFMYSTVLDISHVVSVNEAWVKAFTESDPPMSREEAESIPRGWLEERVGTDPAIHTALMVLVVDVKHPTNSAIWHYDADTGGEILKFNLEDPDDGSMPSRIYHAYLEAKQIGPPPEGADWETVTVVAGRADLIAGAVMGSIHPERRN